jgi:putative glycosyltransferase (TIGR04348 family)
MKILMITPAPPRSRYGNRITALRWARILEGLGHRVRLTQCYQGEPCDLMIALHAQRSHGAMVEHHRRHPGAPMVLALTGTDLYRDLANSAEARASLRMATAMVTLQSLAARELPPSLRRKVRVIEQSAEPLPAGARPSVRSFDVCVVGHLRGLKDPFRAALAARDLPGESRIRILHAGKAMDNSMRKQAGAEQKTNFRYRWLGELPHWQVRRLMGRSRLMVLSSKMEGGANVISEAAVGGLPVLASRIPGNMGLLGQNYTGLFAAGDTEALTKMLLKAENEKKYLGGLQKHMRMIAPRFKPSRERNAWKSLLNDLHFPDG